MVGNHPTAADTKKSSHLFPGSLYRYHRPLFCVVAFFKLRGWKWRHEPTVNRATRTPERHARFRKRAAPTITWLCSRNRASISRISPSGFNVAWDQPTHVNTAIVSFRCIIKTKGRREKEKEKKCFCLRRKELDPALYPRKWPVRMFQTIIGVMSLECSTSGLMLIDATGFAKRIPIGVFPF